jgi:signal transduction histidine kinase
MTDTVTSYGPAGPADASHAHEFLAHEVRNLVNLAILSFEVLDTTGATVAGSTPGRVLRRSLTDLRTLINLSLSDVRSAYLGHRRHIVKMEDFIGDIAAAATLEAHAAAIRLAVLPVEPGLVVHADQGGLAAAVRNLLQNAFKFTRPETTVQLQARACADRVLIEVMDECGGLCGGSSDDLFRPFDQRGKDRSGLGLGLAYSRQVIEAHRGVISVRDRPGHGCIFVIDLPRPVDATTPPVTTPSLP